MKLCMCKTPLSLCLSHLERGGGTLYLKGEMHTIMIVRQLFDMDWVDNGIGSTCEIA